MVRKLEAERFEYDKVPCKGPTIGDLIEYLNQFPPTMVLGILSWEDYVDGTYRCKVCREEPVLEDHHISTVLVSRGAVIEN